MRKGAFLLALVFAAAAMTPASAAKKMAKPDPAIQAQKDSAAFIGDLFHPWAPSRPEMKAKGKKKK